MQRTCVDARIPIGLWMFFRPIHVSAGGADVFLPVCDVLEQDLMARREVRRTAVPAGWKYAIGRCSAAWSVSGSHRARLAWTTLAAGRQLTQAPVGGERAVHGQSRRVAVADWRPFVAGYGSWFQGQAARLCENTCTRPPTEAGSCCGRKETLRCFRIHGFQVMRDHRKHQRCSEHCFHDQEQQALLRHSASPTEALPVARTP